MNISGFLKIIFSLGALILFLVVGYCGFDAISSGLNYRKANNIRQENGDYKIGVGIADITGSAAEMNMMGYAMLNNDSNGIHFRLRSRAFIIQASTSDKRIVFVSADMAMIPPNIKDCVVRELQMKYGNLYTHDNVLLSATHTHSGPGGYAKLVLLDVTNLGYSKKDEEVVVSGIVRSIQRAHDSIVPGQIKLSTGSLRNANINRSPAAYSLNSAEEKHDYSANTDQDMTLLRFDDLNGKPLGILNWFPVHGTSMMNTNGLVSGDNKGRASQLFEEMMNHGALPGEGPFVAAFAQSNEGDVSPNINGPSCPDGSPCDDVHSVCNGQKWFCSAKGPGVTDMDSTDIIGYRQFRKAKELYNAAGADGGIKLSGDVDYRFKWRQMSKVEISTPVGKEDGETSLNKTCSAALGDGFAGGTTDGPGAHPFEQGQLKGNPFFDVVKDWLSKPTKEQSDCHYPKPILLNTGSRLYPIKDHAWTADVLPLQILRVGDLIIVGVPGEFTTMSGRRLRKRIMEAVSASSENEGNQSFTIVIAGLSNSYAHYITTFEEYQLQRYEGGSTLYGPHTLSAFEQEFSQLATDMMNGVPSISVDTPEDFSSFTLNLRPGIVVDGCPLGRKFGDVELQPNDQYSTLEVVKVVFWGAHLANDFMTESSFLYVELKSPISSQEWVTVATDSSWETTLQWERRGVDQSLITIEWTTTSLTQNGTYRIRHNGYHKDLLGNLHFYGGASKEFRVGSSSTTMPTQINHYS